MTWDGIFENLISDIIFVFIMFCIGILILIINKRYFLFKFFGLSKTNILNIYLSNLRIEPFKSLGIDGRKYSFVGETISYKEMKVGLQIEKLFRLPLPDFGDINKLIGKILFSDILVSIMASPTEFQDIDQKSTIISIGTSAYNNVSHYIENLNDSIVSFKLGKATLEGFRYHASASPIVLSDTDNNTYNLSDQFMSEQVPAYYGGTAIADGHYQGDSGASFVAPGEAKYKYESSEILINDMEPITNTSKAVIQKIIDTKNKKTYFLIAGLSELSSVTAASYLVDNWFDLYKKFKANQSFITVVIIDEKNTKICKELYSKKID